MELKLLDVNKILVKDRTRGDVKTGVKILAASIQEVGLIHPILVDDKMNLLAGERRLEAFKELNWDKIPAWTGYAQELQDYVKNTKERRLATELHENIVRIDFTWQERAILERRIKELRKAIDPKWSDRKQAIERNIDNAVVSRRIILAEALEDGTITNIKEGRRIVLAEAFETLPDLANCETEDEAWKKLKRLEEDYALRQKRSKLTEEFTNAPKWAKEHYIIGDAIEGLSKVASDSLDFAEVDPPYAVDLIRVKSRHKTNNIEEYQEWDLEEYKEKLSRIATEIMRVLKDDTFAIFWYGTVNHQITLDILLNAGFRVNPVNAIWYKGQSGQTQSANVMFASCYEPFFLVRKGTPKLNKRGRPNVFDYPMVSHSKKRHPTEKPIDLMLDILSTICRPGSKVVIPFLGSGVTLLAVYQLEMTGFGWDLSEKNRERFLNAVEEKQEEPLDENSL